MHSHLNLKISALAILLVLPHCFADTIILHNEEEIEGEITQEDRSSIVVRLPNGTQRSIKRSDIEIIVFSRVKKKQETLTVDEPDEDETEANEETGEEDGDQGTESVIRGQAFRKKTTSAERDDKAGEGEGAQEPDGKTVASKGKSKSKSKSKAKGKAQKGDKEGEAIIWPEIPKDSQRVFDEAMRLLASQNPADRSAGKSRLRSEGRVLIPALIKGLQHADLQVRMTCADLLGEFGARDAIKYLIEVFYAVMPEKGQAPTYQRTYVRSLKSTLSRVTGQSFVTVQPKSPLVQVGLKKYIDWYNENIDRLPPQVGEPEIDPTSKNYIEEITEVRKLKLTKRTWPRPPLSAEIAVGKTKSENPPSGSTERRPDLVFKENFPKTDRESAGGYFRKDDRKFGNDFFKR